MAKRILLVEDEAPIREMLKFVLEKSGYETVEAEDYQIALDKIVEPFPDLILLDFAMPESNGFQICQELGQYPQLAEIPIIMMTTRGDPIAQKFLKKIFESQVKQILFLPNR